MAPPTDLVDTITETVAEYEEVRPEDLPPLVDELDGEIVERLTDTESAWTEPLGFEYLWYDVTVLSREAVVVTP